MDSERRVHASHAEEQVAAAYRDVRDAILLCRQATLSGDDDARRVAYRASRELLEARLARLDEAMERLMGGR